jgi:pyridinium-3,5-bisthiocarboxylic acid mononucleotide nickel chelatase
VKVGQLLFLEPVGGIAGDMFLAAALDAGVPPDALERAIATLGLRGVRLAVTRAESGGVVGTHLDVIIEELPARALALSEIAALIGASGLAPRAREVALALFERIGHAESKVRGVPLEAVRLHERGALDSVVDVCGAAAALDLLGWPRVLAVAPELGQGTVKTLHGLMPVPQPLVLEILKGTPVRAGGPVGEAVTPTGAALLAGLCQPGPPPHFTPRAVGYGVGTTRWPDRPNVLRMTLGEESDAPLRLGTGSVALLESNLDDCPGQLVARAIQVALESGALDAWASPCTMKKGRPGIVLSALAPEERRDGVARVFLSETTTLGVRVRRVERVELDRELVPVDTAYGTVRVKVGRLAGELMGAHPEYEDCAARSRERGVPVKEVMDAAMAAWRARTSG